MMMMKMKEKKRDRERERERDDVHLVDMLAQCVYTYLCLCMAGGRRCR